MGDVTGFAGQPGPYSAGPSTGRTGEFATGATGTGDIATATPRASTGLTDDSLQFAAQTPAGVVQTSVLQPYRPSMNGISQGDYDQRVLPGGVTLPSSNGSSLDSYQKAIYMRLQGQDEG